MAKQTPIKKKEPIVQKTATKAQTAFDEYKKRMDEQYAQYTNAQQVTDPPVYYPMYSLPEVSDDSSTKSNAVEIQGTDSKSLSQTGSNIIDGVTRLLDLSVQTMNTTLEGWMKMMNKFYGVHPQQQYSSDHGDCGCHQEHDHSCDCHSHSCCESSCGCEDCQPGVHNCA